MGATAQRLIEERARGARGGLRLLAAAHALVWVAGCGGDPARTDASVPAVSDASLDASSAPSDAGRDAHAEPDASMDIDAAPDAWFAPTLAIEPTALDFGSVLAGTSSSAARVRVTNPGDTPTGELDALVTGADASAFVVVSDTCSATSLAPNASCELEVTLMPASTVLWDLSALLDVTMASGTTASVTLSGRSVAAIDAVVEPSVADFGAARLGSSTTAQAFTVRSSGTEPTGVVGVTITGANPDDFVIDAATSTCPGEVVPPMSTCVVNVFFRPTAPGARAASLRFTAAPGGTPTAALTGTGLSL